MFGCVCGFARESLASSLPIPPPRPCSPRRRSEPAHDSAARRGGALDRRPSPTRLEKPCRPPGSARNVRLVGPATERRAFHRAPLPRTFDTTPSIEGDSCRSACRGVEPKYLRANHAKAMRRPAPGSRAIGHRGYKTPELQDTGGDWTPAVPARGDSGRQPGLQWNERCSTSGRPELIASARPGCADADGSIGAGSPGA